MYETKTSSEMVARGYAIRSRYDLNIALSKYGIRESTFESAQGAVDFDKEFVFIVVNGNLIEIYSGNSGFDIAAITPSTSFSIAVVHGPKSRPLKAVSR